MDKYTLLELTILEERIGKRIPPEPEMNWDTEHVPTEYDKDEHVREVEDWREKYKKEQNALNKIKVEISKRLDEVINAE